MTIRPRQVPFRQALLDYKERESSPGKERDGGGLSAGFIECWAIQLRPATTFPALMTTQFEHSTSRSISQIAWSCVHNVSMSAMGQSRRCHAPQMAAQHPEADVPDTDSLARLENLLVIRGGANGGARNVVRLFKTRSVGRPPRFPPPRT